MDVCGECDPDACDGDHLNDRANQELLRIWENFEVCRQNSDQTETLEDGPAEKGEISL